MSKSTPPNTTTKPKAGAKSAKSRARSKNAQGKTSASRADFKQERKLNLKQCRFVQEYLIDLNATQAAIRAGYSEKTAYSQGQRLLKNVEIALAIKNAMDLRANSVQITAERVLLEVARLAMYDPRKFFSNAGEPLGIHEIDDDTAAAIAGMEVVEQYENMGDGKREFMGYLKKYKLADKGPNLERLMKHLGLYERDNEQKTDPLTTLLHGIATRNAGAFMPVAIDPERNEEKAQSGFKPVTDDEDHDED